MRKIWGPRRWLPAVVGILEPRCEHCDRLGPLDALNSDTVERPTSGR